ncbi:hypothetical protein A3844_21065 [Paenibacillus helianthi]|uniref:Carrier domain-containing protein n=1 Tax=Paenibacillus helianthi TaxID=1349432 RepID=A0ABX3EMR4_9BACL|nr:non-ribosomal peptide synthetase [Paenibacillus helianthi]OKP83967.1 hypothetical protein A3844_21065 [Paenibacillus helianthi]
MNLFSKDNIKDVYHLSSMQEGMLFHSLYQKNEAYHEQIRFSVKGSFDVLILEKCFNLLIERHEVLRTIFSYKNTKNPLQIVLKKQKNLHIKYKNISHELENVRINMISDYIKEDKKNSFRLTKDVPMRVAVFEMGEEQFEVIWSFHHIVIDGWSLGILFGELLQIYESLNKGTRLQLETAQPYSRFIQWLEKQDKAKGSDYWQNYLKTIDVVTTLPGYKKTVGQERYEQEELCFALGEEQTRILQQLANKYQVTLNTMMQTIWGIVLQKYNRTNEVVFGAVVSGRPAVIPGIEKMVGLFINTIPVRISNSPTQQFTEVLKAVQYAASESDAYSSYPLYEIQNQCTLKQDLINHIMVFENYPMDDRLKDMGQTAGVGLELSNFNTFEQTNYDFNVILIPEKELAIKFSYNLNAFEPGSVERMKGHLQHVIKQIIANPNATIDEIEMVTAEEKEQLVYLFNQTKAGYPSHQTIHQLFEEQVQKTPENIAVAAEGRQLTYRQLNERSNQLARALRSHGVKPDVIVALMLDRSIEMIISILAVLKAGGTYLPIDPDYPAERVEYILEDSKASFLITTGEYVAATTFSGVTFNLSEELDVISEEEITNLEGINSPQDAAYIIYTSGTTGLPKGVIIEHRNVIRLVLNDEMEFDFNANDVWTMFHSYCFDVSVWEMYGALLYGGKLVIVPKFIAQSPEALTDLLLQEEVTVLNQTPTAFYALMQEGSNFIGNDLALRYIIFAGEALSPKKIYKVKIAYPHTKLINMYGITEVTVHTTYREVTMEDIESEKSNIGHPIPTTTMYILDEQQKLVPVGVIGELFVGGKGIARGYLNREELTRNRFIANPFKPEEKMYRSGDLARWLPDGTLEYMGRMDHQVKIRGYRIECGEIEAQLLKHDSVNEAVVMARESDDGSKYLCAYLVSETTIDVTELRRHLEKLVPSYMVPAYFIDVVRIPLTSNGKVDRKALPLPKEGWMRGNEYVAPQGALEEQLAEIWKKVLGIEQVGRTDDFFELGGHSIKAVQLELELEKNGFQVEEIIVYSYRTIKEMAFHFKNLNLKSE